MSPTGLPRGGAPSIGADRRRVLRFTHDWFEVNSGWAPPDPETLTDWALEGGCRAPDDCWVDLTGNSDPTVTCEHGLVSWREVLDDLTERDRLQHGQCCEGGGSDSPA